MEKLQNEIFFELKRNRRTEITCFQNILEVSGQSGWRAEAFESYTDTDFPGNQILKRQRLNVIMQVVRFNEYFKTQGIQFAYKWTWYLPPEFTFAHLATVPKSVTILITSELISLDLSSLICMWNVLGWMALSSFSTLSLCEFFSFY